MQNFDYAVPQSVAEVVSLLSSDDGQVRVMSGGTDLLVQLREGRRQAHLLVDVKQVPEVNLLAYDKAGGLRLGAAVPCYRICQDSEVRAAYPGLVDAIALIGGVQIQGRATVGGNLCNASPAADAIPALIVHGASCLIVGPEGERTLPVEEFCVGPGLNALRPGEFLVSIQVPPPDPRSTAAYLRFIPRNEMDIAVVGAAAWIRLDESLTHFEAARIALGAVAPTPLLVREAGEALAGQVAGAESIAEAARLAQAAARPITDMRGTAAQRRHLCAVLTRRALEKAIARALDRA